MILEANGIEFGYRSDPTLSDITFSIDAGDVLTILGPNGVGKTTLLKCLNRVLKYRCGAIMVEGRDISLLHRKQIAQRMGYVPQKGELSKMTVFDSILLGRKPHIEFDASKKDLRLTGRVIELLGLSDLTLRRIDEISGGEYQLVQIARALVQQPRIILLDEPTSNLDLKNQHTILVILEKIVRANRMATIMTMHDLNLAIRYSKKFLIMKSGKIIAAGGNEIITPELIKAVYDVDVMVEAVKGIPVVMPV